MTDSPVFGVLYAGGAGRRMGGVDKAMLELGGKVMWRYALERFESHDLQVLVTGAVEPSWCAMDQNLSFVRDAHWTDGRQVGPAAGILAALEYVRDRAGESARVVTSPVDTPFVSPACVGDLVEASNDADVVVMEADGRLQPAFANWRAGCAPQVRAAIETGNTTSLVGLARGFDQKILASEARPGSFANINSPDDLARAQASLKS